MRRVVSIAAALALACTAVAIFAGSLLAQADGRLYDACSRDKEKIRAGALPGVLDEERCPVAGRVIVDGGVGAVVPGPGMAVTAEADTPGGDQHLVVSNPRGDEIVLNGVGEETATEGSALSRPQSRASGPSACRDSYYTNRDSKLYDYNRWYVNAPSIPSYLSGVHVVGAMQRGGLNIYGVRDSCGFADGVRGRLIYVGGTTRSVNIRSNATCTSNDFRSVVGFGDLPSGYTAFNCVWTWVQDGPNRVAHSDIRLNKFDLSWTTGVTGSCRGRYDIESTMTHERGHTFGLGEASEGSHGNLTMSQDSNGPCQISERSLGRGDALGLNRKY